MEEMILTFLTIITLISSIANAGTNNADAVSSTVDVDALIGRHIALSAFPPTVALAAATGVLAITTAEHRTGSWTTHMQEAGSVNILALQTADKSNTWTLKSSLTWLVWISWCLDLLT